MKIFLLPFLLFSITSLFGAEVETTDGKRYEGTIKAESEKEVVLGGESGIEMRIPRENIAKLTYKDTPPKFKKDYWGFGATLGTPGIINVNLWRMWETFGLQFSGGYLGTAYGIQANLAWKIGDYAKFVHCFFVGAGSLSISTKKNNVDQTSQWTYGVVGYNLNWYGWFLEAGASFGSGSYSNPQFMAQGGFVYRFNSAD